MKRHRKRKNKSKSYRKSIYDTTNFLIKELKKYNIVIQRYDSKSSNSVYLKLDYGLLNSIRISDHKGKKHLNYKYNALTVCPYPISTRNKTDFGETVRYYVPLNKVNVLLHVILKDRTEKITLYGENSYRKYMKLKISEGYFKKGFWQSGKIV